MSKGQIVKSMLVSTIIVLFLIISPVSIQNGIKKGRVSAFSTDEESFMGVIEIWHVAGFKAYSGAVGNLLKSCATDVSDRHFGVYFKVISMSETEYAERIARGESADIYSLPLGFEYGDKFKVLDENKFLNVKQEILQTGASDGSLLAVPYLYSGYCVAANCEILKQEPDDIEPDILTDICANLSSEKHTAMSGDELCAALYGFTGDIAPIEQFKSGYSEFAVTDFRTIGDIERKNADGKGFPLKIFPCSSYTDLVQYISFNSKITDEKSGYAYELLQNILSSETQMKIADMGAYTVIEGEDASALRDRYTSVAGELFTLYIKPRIPNSFSYRVCRDSLTADAQAVLRKESLRNKLVDRIDELMGE